MANPNLTRFFGGSPGPVLLRLIGLSVVVGIILSALDLHPRQVLYHISDMAIRIYNMGFEAIHWAIEYFLLGALIVFPIWIFMRVTKIGRREP